MENIEYIKDINNLNVGDPILMKAPFSINESDVVFAVVTFKDLIEKYPITDEDGRKWRSMGRGEDGNIIQVFPEDEGCIGNEKIISVDIKFEPEGSCHLEETDNILDLKICKIGKSHPRFDEKLYERSQNMSKAFEFMEKYIGEDGDWAEDDLEKMMGDIMNQLK